MLSTQAEMGFWGGVGHQCDITTHHTSSWEVLGAWSVLVGESDSNTSSSMASSMGFIIVALDFSERRKKKQNIILWRTLLYTRKVHFKAGARSMLHFYLLAEKNSCLFRSMENRFIGTCDAVDRRTHCYRQTGCLRH